MSIKPKDALAYGLAGLFALVSSAVVVGILVSYFTYDVADADHPSAPRTPGAAHRGRPDLSKQASTKSPPVDRRQPTQQPPKSLRDLPKRGGKLVARTPDGQRIELPSVKADYNVDIRGDLATVTVEQRFKNPGDVPLNATYQFPLSKDAAVYEMVMRVGDERIRAEIKKQEEARKTFEKAKHAGKAAALLEQHRPNVFTQEVANLMPQKPVDVTLRYVEAVDKVDGRYQVVVPMVVGPRYNPSDMSQNWLVQSDGPEDGVHGAHEGKPSDGNTRSDVPDWLSGDADVPQTVDRDRISVHVRIDGGVPVRDIQSASHAIDVAEFNPRDWQVELAGGRSVANKHFVLSYDLEGADTDAGVLSSWNQDYNEGYFSVLVEPPAKPAAADITPREMVFLLDCSGSMGGQPMDASKAFMRDALRRLRPTDHFRIIRFSDTASEYTTEPQQATDANVDQALAYVNGLHGRGGTRMTSGIMQALDAPVPDNTVRMVTFLTDGYIGNEYEIIRMVGDKIGDARLFSLGVGNGVNRFLLDEMGRMGRGFTKYLDPTEDVGRQTHALANRLQTPVLTDISIDWGKLSPRETTPEQIPDLFDGQSVRVMGRYQTPGAYTIHVRGTSGTKQVDLPVEVTLPAKAGDGKAVELTWARQTIKEHMHTLETPKRLRETELNDDQLKDIITQMGLDYSLVTQWTSFVAVSEKVVNPNPANAADGEVPESPADGVSQQAYAANNAANGSQMHASAPGTPEPAVWAGMVLMLLAAAGIAVDRRRDGGRSASR